MKPTKTLLSLFLVLLTVLAVFPAGTATASAAATGGAYTKDQDLAKKLTNVFNGKVKLFSNTNATYPVGTSIDNNFEYTWGTSYPNWGAGYQCFAYAQSVYYYLFDEIAGSADRTYTKSEVVLRAKDKLLYRDLLGAGIGCGAYFRTTNNADYSYNSSYGHSFILLTYDADTVTILEGNADYHGLVAINVFTWDEFNEQRLNNQNRRLAFAIQPKRTRWSVTAPADTFTVGATKNAAAKNLGEDAVGLSWSKVKGATMYHVYRYSAASKSYEYYDTAYENSYTDYGLTMGVTYYYKVRAVKAVGGETLLGALSAAVSATPMADLPAKLSLPEYVRATPGCGRITLRWDPVRYANLYYIYRYNEKTKKYEYVDYTSDTAYTAGDLTDGSVYSFKIRAVAKYPTVSVVYSDLTGEITEKAGLKAPDYVYGESGGFGAVNLYWGETDAGFYCVYVFNEAKKKFEYIGYTKECNYTVTGLTAGRSYRFKVRSAAIRNGQEKYSPLSEETVASPGMLPGDLDGSGAVEAADARIALRIAVGLETSPDWAIFNAADVDGDGEITSADARLILRRAVGFTDPEFRA